MSRSCPEIPMFVIGMGWMLLVWTDDFAADWIGVGSIFNA